MTLLYHPGCTGVLSSTSSLKESSLSSFSKAKVTDLARALPTRSATKPRTYTNRCILMFLRQLNRLQSCFLTPREPQGKYIRDRQFLSIAHGHAITVFAIKLRR